MKLYIAASVDRSPEVRQLVSDLRLEGHDVKATWAFSDSGYQRSQEDLISSAASDLEEIRWADGFVMLTGDNLSRGGRHTELGYAMALEKRIVIVGKPQSVFEFAQVQVAASFSVSCALLE